MQLTYILGQLQSKPFNLLELISLISCYNEWTNYE